jgi:hypothetical protein
MLSDNFGSWRRMGVTKKAKVTFTCEHAMKDYLSEWADSENRTISNLVETLIGEAIAARTQNKPPTSGTSAKGNGTKRRGKAGGEE